MNSGDRNIIDSRKMKLTRVLGNLQVPEYIEVMLETRLEDTDPTPLKQQMSKEENIIDEKLLYQLL